MNPMVCAGCGEWSDTPVVDTETSTVVCSACGHHEPIHRLPLLCLTGPSGTGKSTVGRLLSRRFAGDVLVLEQDVLWVPGLRDPRGDHAAFRTTWLRLIAALNRSGRPVLLCGTVVPPELEHRPERALIGDIHYLALVCEPETLRSRLRARPAWRAWNDRRIAETLEFNEWIQANAAHTSPPMTLLDTTVADVDETARSVAHWMTSTLTRSLAG